METSFSTSLLILWAVDDAAAPLERREKKAGPNIGSFFLRSSVASVLLMERCNGFAEIFYRLGAGLINSVNEYTSRLRVLRLVIEWVV